MTRDVTEEDGLVGLQVSPRRPLARLVAGAVGGRRPTGAGGRVPAYVPRTHEHRHPAPEVDAGDEANRAAVAVRVLDGLLAAPPDEAVALGELLAPDVDAWSPTMRASSRDELLEVLRGEGRDDTLSDVELSVDRVDDVGSHVYVEWRLTGRFTNPCFIDDDLLIEPTGRPVATSGVLVVGFDGPLVGELRCYYDDLALLEQLVTER